MKKFFPSIALTCVLATLAFAATAQVQHLDRVVAIVNKDVVLESELQERMAAIQNQARMSGTSLPPLDDLRRQVLDHLIVERLQLGMAERYGIEIPDEQVNAALAEMIARSNLPEEEFWQEVRGQGFTPQTLREKVRKDIAIQQVQRGVVQQRVHISEHEVTNFLNSTEGEFWRSPEYKLGHILVSLPQSPSRDELAQAEKKAQELYEKLKQGAVFAEVAIAESDGPAALSGGDLGWRRSGELPTLFAEIAPTLAPGEVSKPQRSAAGFHILKLYEVRGQPEQEVITQNRSRHILLEPTAIRSSEEAYEQLKEIRQKIVSGEAEFAEMAREHSDDIGSALQGGDLGWANPGQFVPEFEKLAQNQPIGEISEPFQTQYGWHILQVQERREQDMSDELLRHKARNMLMSRRFEDELQVWQRELRDEAYIKIKLDDDDAES